jgi:hypothetical protein
MEAAEAQQQQIEAREAQQKELERQQKEAARAAKSAPKAGPTFEDVFTRTVKRQVSNTLVREITRGFLGILKSSFKRK